MINSGTTAYGKIGFGVLRVLSAVLYFAVLLLGSSVANCSAQSPNIILINFDDADSEMFEQPDSGQRFPNIMDVANSGISFSNLHVTTPICGPSRASLYRGQYAHNTGIKINDPSARSSNHFDGGLEFYQNQGYFRDDLSMWMKNAGYRTMMVGKFLHHGFKKIIPPGWDDFHFYQGSRYWNTWRLTNEKDPKGKMDQLPPDLYRTTEETRDVVRTLERHVAQRGDQPFFLNVNTLGPHEDAEGLPGMIDSQMANLWPDIKTPPTDAFNEADFSDKRGMYRDLPKLSGFRLQVARDLYRNRQLATKSCDEMVGEIRRTLARLNIDHNTYILITSDNGFSTGHHRLLGKGTSTDRSTRVPLFVMGPDVPEGRTANHLMAHIDLAPTIVALAGRKTPDFVDGRSFAHLLTPTGIDEHSSFRDAVLIENWVQFTIMGKPAESPATALRTTDTVYTEWANGEKDYYDLKSDPQQLDNSFDELQPIYQDFLASWLRQLKNSEQTSNARFTIPFEHREKLTIGQSLRGLAEDPQGVAQVKLAIRDLDGKRYWNGSAWQAEFVLVEAELENPEGQISFWNYEAMPAGDNVVTEMAAWAWSYDNNFVYDKPSLAVFRN